MQIVNKEGKVILEKEMPRVIHARMVSVRLRKGSEKKFVRSVAMRKEDFDGSLF